MKIVVVETRALSLKQHVPANLFARFEKSDIRGITERVLTGQQQVYSIQCHS